MKFQTLHTAEGQVVLTVCSSVSWRLRTWPVVGNNGCIPSWPHLLWPEDLRATENGKKGGKKKKCVRNKTKTQINLKYDVKLTIYKHMGRLSESIQTNNSLEHSLEQKANPEYHANRLALTVCRCGGRERKSGRLVHQRTNTQLIHIRKNNAYRSAHTHTQT